MTDNPEIYVNAEVWTKIVHKDDNYHKGYISHIYYDNSASQKYFVVNFETDPACGFFPVNSFDIGLLFLYDPTKYPSNEVGLV